MYGRMCVCGLYCFVTEYFMFPFRLEFFNNVGVTSSSCTFITSQENLKDFLILPPSLPNINGYKNANALKHVEDGFNDEKQCRCLAL